MKNKYIIVFGKLKLKFLVSLGIMHCFLFPCIFWGIFESLYGLGSIIGFPIAGGVLSLWVDFNRVDVINLTPYDYGWVGAWWFGFLIIAIVYFFLSLPLFLFPNRVNHARNYTTDINDDEKDTDEEVKKSVLTNLKGTYTFFISLKQFTV